MDCGLELKRGVDKGPLKRGTFSVHKLLLFRECSSSLSDDHETSRNRRQQPFTQASS